MTTGHRLQRGPDLQHAFFGFTVLGVRVGVAVAPPAMG